MVAVTWAGALAWRLDRQHLVSGAKAVVDVVERLSAVPAWSGDADLAVGRRLAQPGSDTIAAARERGDLLATYAFRGASHHLAAADAGAYMRVRGANRQWERRSWREHYRLEPEDWPALRETVRTAVADGPVTRSELIERVVERPRFRHLREGLSDPSHTLLKPFAWAGDLCFGPSREGDLTYQSPESSARWTGLPDLDEAGKHVVSAYLAGHGPATRENLRHWLVAGLSAGQRRLDAWVADLLEDQVVEVQVDGAPMLHLRAHLDALLGAEPRTEVTLLPGHDQWVMGPGTADERIVPPAHRSAVTRGGNLVLVGGVVVGTWTHGPEGIDIAWFSTRGRPPRAQVDSEAGRVQPLLALGHQPDGRD